MLMASSSKGIMTKTIRHYVAVQRVVARVMARSSDATAAKRLLISEIAPKLGCHQGFSYCFGGFAPAGRTRILDFAQGGHGGGIDPSTLQSYWSSILCVQPRLGPVLDALVRHPARVGVVTPGEVLREGEWEQTGIPGRLRAWGLGPLMVGFFRLRQHERVVQGRVSTNGDHADEHALGFTLGLHRRVGAAEFTGGEVDLLRRVMLALRRLARDGHFPLHPPEAHPVGLSIRQNQVLQLLLRGHSAKEAAGELGISSLTVSGYIKDIYRHFNVHSRAELLSRFIRRQGVV